MSETVDQPTKVKSNVVWLRIILHDSIISMLYGATRYLIRVGRSRAHRFGALPYLLDGLQHGRGNQSG